MPRIGRNVVGGVVYHVLNRGNGRMRIFRKPFDYLAFVALLAEALRAVPGVELFAFTLMPNHWHLVLRPRADRDLSRFMSWLTNTHVKRYRTHYPGTSGHLYQGRFKSFPIEQDDHLLTVLRYVEANALRAKLASRAETWAYCSLAMQRDPKSGDALISDWPIERPNNWTARVNDIQPATVVERVRTSIVRGRPFGGEAWTKRIAGKMGLSHSLRPRGRPKKSDQDLRK